jgi:cytochrome c biogenesis protein CcdA
VLGGVGVGLVWFELFHYRVHAGLVTGAGSILRAQPGLAQRSSASFLVAFTIGSAIIWMPCILQMVLVFTGVTAGARGFRGGWFFAGYIGTFAGLGVVAAGIGDGLARLHVVGALQITGGLAIAVVGLCLLRVLRTKLLASCGSAVAFAMSKGRLHRLGRPSTGAAFALYCAGCCGPLLVPLYVFLAASGSFVLGAITSAGFALAMALPITALGLAGGRALRASKRVVANYEVISQSAGMALLTLGALLVLSGPLVSLVAALHR